MLEVYSSPEFQNMWLSRALRTLISNTPKLSYFSLKLDSVMLFFVISTHIFRTIFHKIFWFQKKWEKAHYNFVPYLMQNISFLFGPMIAKSIATIYSTLQNG